MEMPGQSQPTVEVHRFGMPHELHEGDKIEERIAIDRSPSEIFAFCRDQANLKRILPRLKQVDWLGGGRSHWIYELPNGMTVDWECELIAETRNRMISWRTSEGSSIYHAGSIWFLPEEGERKTTVQILIQISIQFLIRYSGHAIPLTRETISRWIDEDLHRLRDLIENLH